MKETSQKPAAVKTPKQQTLLGLAMLTSIVTLFLLNGSTSPSMLTYLLSIPALAMISFTALARANDIKAEQSEWNWQLRRFGLSFLGCAAAALILMPLGDKTLYPNWVLLMAEYGMAVTMFTTPGLVPWWKFMFKGENGDDA